MIKCNNCFHLLPDDSEFCQYCGIRIEEKRSEKSANNISNESTSSEPSSFANNTDDELMNMFVKIVGDNLIANANEQPDNEDDPDFGLVPEKPIYTAAIDLVQGERDYLNDLRTENGEPVKFERVGSTISQKINGVIDIYQTYLLSGVKYKILYINMYGASKSRKAPAGFYLKSLQLKNSSSAEKYNQKQSFKKPREKYCKKCGKKIIEKRCEYCHPKKKIEKKSHIVVVLSALILCLFVCSIVLGFLYYNTKLQISDLNDKLLIQESSFVNKNKEQEAEFLNITKNFFVEKGINIGYVSDRFYADKDFIVLKPAEKSSLFVFSYENFDLECFGNSIDVDKKMMHIIGSQTTYQRKLDIEAKNKGITEICITNRNDNKTFSIIVIVI